MHLSGVTTVATTHPVRFCGSATVLKQETAITFPWQLPFTQPETAPVYSRLGPISGGAQQQRGSWPIHLLSFDLHVLQTYHALAEIFHSEPHVVIAQLDAKLNERIGHR